MLCLFAHPYDLDVQYLGRHDGRAFPDGVSALQLVLRSVDLPLYGDLSYLNGFESTFSST